MIDGIAIDCGWLIELEDADYDELLAAFELVKRMLEADVRLLIDHEGHIIGEYSKYMTDMKHGKALLKKLLASCTSYVSGTPSGTCKAGLDADAFDPSDRPYIAVAQNGNGIYITHEEKHLTQARCAKVAKHCNVTIASTADIPALLTK
ncbi:hypothetical protein PP614_14020 [Mycobacteroides abscessus]|uniref:STAS/SEC14 domain-containing protein n=1 Tax=Mycobacteroides abscessus TaxID=36809 RepID=UPI00078D070A|nr:STAS/SEC14 domain-containing protein [Mycobacteroides abscessus]AMU55263.1 hypothetical protein A3O02_08860 [Mycobacteroides abscessus]MBE5437047.1 hypothetical protein [Mycobacteroides abscessus]MBN7447082.1 hypothetical protein [Mycobacteroides abscessus subsp. abscessus]MDM1901765.1 hypothetical protein [Mycobacteroides abscessus]MDM1961361.1 hypothetical protein [Mycobacteroides abscessus]